MGVVRVSVGRNEWERRYGLVWRVSSRVDGWRASWWSS